MTQTPCKPCLSIPGNLPEITAAWAFGVQKIRTTGMLAVLWGAVVLPQKLNICPALTGIPVGALVFKADRRLWRNRW